AAGEVNDPALLALLGFAQELALGVGPRAGPLPLADARPLAATEAAPLAGSAADLADGGQLADRHLHRAGHFFLGFFLQLGKDLFFFRQFGGLLVLGNIEGIGLHRVKQILLWALVGLFRVAGVRLGRLHALGLLGGGRSQLSRAGARAHADAAQA